MHSLMREVGGTFSIDDALQVVLQTLNALAYAHTVNISKMQSGEEEMSSGSTLVHCGAVESITTCRRRGASCRRGGRAAERNARPW